MARYQKLTLVIAVLFTALCMVTACTGHQLKSVRPTSVTTVAPPPPATPSVVCVGSCGPLYDMAVGFRGGTTKPQALAALRACQDLPEVAKVDVLEFGGGKWQQPGYHEIRGEVYLRSMESGATGPVRACLAKQSAVTATGGFPG